jgi:hypothetical protein
MIARNKRWQTAGLVGCLLTLSATVGGQTRTISDSARVAIDSAIAIQGVGPEPITLANGKTAARLRLELRSTSEKTIYAFGYAVMARYADGSTESKNGLSVDLLPLYFEQSIVPETGRKFLTPLLRHGETYTDAGFLSNFPLDSSQSLPISVQPNVTMLLFEDGSAIGDSKLVQQIFDARRAQAEEIAGVIQDLRDILQADDPLKAAAVREEDVLAGRAKDKDGNPVGWTTFTDSEGKLIHKTDWRQARAADLQNALMGTNGEKSQIVARIAKNEQFLTMLKEHAAPAKVIQ